MIGVEHLIVGCWQQPASSLAKWAGRGVNTLIDFPLGSDGRTPLDTAARKTAFDAAADAGIRVIAEPDATDPHLDLSFPAFLAWLQKPDEPENPEHVPTKDAAGRPDYRAHAALWQMRYAALKAVSPPTPVFANFNGMILTAARESWVGTTKPPKEQVIIHDEYRAYMRAADWVSADWHVRNSNRTSDKIVPHFKTMIERLTSFGGGKPVFAFVECAHQNRVEGGPAPSPSDMRAEAWTALILGAKGICYFPSKIRGGYVSDNTPPELVAEMQRINKEIAAAEPWILGSPRIAANVANGIGAIWTSADGTSVSASIQWEANTGQWITLVTVPNELTLLRKENAGLKERLRKIDVWIGSYPR